MDSLAYIVAGDTGEYSDHCAWYVRAFLDKDAAEAFCKRLNDWCIEQGFDPHGKNVRDYSFQRPKCPMDPEFMADYTGTAYCVVEVPLEMASQYNVGN